MSTETEFGETRKAGLFSSIMGGKKDKNDPFAQPANVVGLGATNFDFLGAKVNSYTDTHHHHDHAHALLFQC
jgi:hypothetical protein